MYRKALINGEELYFVYAPPQTELDRESRAFPKPPYLGAPRELSTVYYYWWAFLRLNKSYIDFCNTRRGELGELYQDFGDVRGEDFVDWWKRHGAHCFAEPRQSERVTKVWRLPESHDFETHALMSVPLAADIELTLSELRSQLKPLFDQYREDNGHFSKARYKVTSKPVLSSLDQILGAKMAKIAHPTASAAELAQRACLNIGRDDANHRVHVFLKKADRLIANVIKGNFPDFSDPDKPKPTRARFDPAAF